MRKGQIAIFVILGIVIVVAIIVAVSLKKQIIVPKEETQTSIELQQTTKEVKFFVENCLNKALKDAVITALNNGAVSPLTEANSVEIYNIRAPIYFKDSIEALPAKDDLKDVISKYATLWFLSCTDNFVDFEGRGITVEDTGSISSEIKISEKEAVIVLDYPIKIKKDGQTAKISRFSSSVEIDAVTPYEEAIALYQKIKQHESEEQIARFVSEKPYQLGVEHFEKNRVYVLRFDNYDEFPLLYPFAIQEPKVMPQAEKVADTDLKALLSLPDLFLIDTPKDIFTVNMNDVFDEVLIDTQGGVKR